MDIKQLFAKLKCPRNVELDKCLTALGSSNEQLGEAQSAIATLTQQLQECQQGSSADLLALIKERDELLALSRLLTGGPEPPSQSKMRWLPQAYIDQVMAAQLGTKYSLCPAKHFSEGDYLVCSKEEMRRFIDYYALFWMPHIKYVTQQWTKLDGSQVEIWMNDCDDFADFFAGINALNANWACFPWGKIWAEVQGLMLAGGHAFNCLLCCDDTYKETSPIGLKAYLLEPQMAGGGPWPAARPRPAGYELKELKEVAGFFEIKGTMWMVEF